MENEKLIDDEGEYRICSVCGKKMREGYMVEGGGGYYCSDECLHKEMTEEEYEKYYEDGVMFYTEWY